MNKIKMAAVACFAALSNMAFAQVGGVGDKPAYVAPTYDMPAGKIYVDVNKIAKPRPAFKTVRIKESCTDPTCGGDNFVNQYALGFNSGSFRVGCSLSHVAFDDPLVFPGQSGRTHGHQFFGNTKTRAATDVANMAASGDSTCAGGILNRTGYWAPFYVYHCPPETAVARGCNAARNGEPVFGEKMNFYYKNATDISSNTTIWPPAGLRMIAGNATATSPQNGSVAKYQCYANYGAPPDFGSIPTKAQAAVYGGCNYIDMIIYFPACWDGVNLDSPNHQSHMAYRNAPQTCAQLYPGTYPVTIPDISLNIVIKIKDQNDLDFLRLTSDRPASDGYLPGISAHADWVDGWDRTPNLMGWGSGTLTDILMLQCGSKNLPLVNGSPQHRDCHNNLLGRPNPNRPTTTYMVY